MISILARASARYEGRIDAELSLGDLSILIRDYERDGDGSVLIHDMQSGIPPRNWMPAGSIMEEVEGGYLFVHEKRKEKLEVFIDTIYSVQYHPPTLATQLTKLGAEREFSDLLSKKLYLIDSDMTLVGREWRTAVGPVDLLCEDKEMNLICVEVKRRKIDVSSIWQMKRYLHSIKQTEKRPVRGIMVAPSLANPAKEALKKEKKIVFARVTYEELCGKPKK